MPLRRAVVRLVREGAPERAHALLQGASPAWAAHCAAPLVDSQLGTRERTIEMEERLMDTEAAATHWMRPLRAAATIASAIGFIGAAVEVHWVINGEHGLAALEAGAVESEGLGKAILSIALGIATSSLALGSWTLLKKVALSRIADARRLVSSLEEVLLASPLGAPNDDSGEATDGT